MKLRLLPRACRARLWRAALGLAAAGLAGAAPGAVSDLSNVPLETASASAVKPNIFFVLDNSGSMDWTFLPDWAGTAGGTAATDDSNYSTATELTLTHNSRYNGIYYDPAVTYTPPVH